MENRYIVTTSGSFIDVDDLYHAGIKGMKWGVRRYQNPDGSLTPAGRKRYSNPDGTLNKRGEKFYAKETARLKAESERLANEKKTSAKLAKLDQMRQKNNKLKEEIDGKKPDSDSKSESKTADKLSKEYDMSSLTKQEIDDYKNRLQSEDNLKDLLVKRGYKVSLDQKTEIDRRIEALDKQKKLLELEKEVDKLSRGKTATEEKIEKLTQQSEIAKLEKTIRDNTPKKENKLLKFMGSKEGQEITKQLITSGENIIKTRMQQKGNKNADLTSEGIKAVTDKVGKTLGNEVNKVSKSVEKHKEKEAAKEAKAEEKQAKKEAKAAEREAKKEAKAAEREAKKTAKELDRLVDSDFYEYGSKAYERKVDKLLAEMDDKAWEIYLNEYANK